MLENTEVETLDGLETPDVVITVENAKRVEEPETLDTLGFETIQVLEFRDDMLVGKDLSCLSLGNGQ